MEMSERMKNALAALEGTGARPVPAGSRPRSRPVSSIRSDADVKSPKTTAKALYSQCRKKGRYRSEHDARLAANMASAARGVALRVYKCPFCGGWHMTKKFKEG